MAHPCHDCGKVLATQGGLDVHRVQWCAGTETAPVAPVARLRLLGRRRGQAPDQAAGPHPAEPVPPDAPVEPGEGTEQPAVLPERYQEIEQAAPPIDLTTDSDGEVELSLIMWLMRRRVRTERLPAGRTVLRFDFTGSRKESFWVVLEPPDVTLCITSPRLDVDAVVTADAGAFRRVFLGRMLLADALSDELVHLQGPEALVQSLPRWFEWSRPVTAPTGAG